MPQPNSPHIVSPPAVQAQPYSAEDGAVSTAPWEEVLAGQCDIHTGVCSGNEWPDSGVWKQV
jgi:hypothetical protein